MMLLQNQLNLILTLQETRSPSGRIRYERGWASNTSGPGGSKDMEKTILEKARIKILGKAPTDMVTLTFQEGRSPDELRKEILDTTKRGPIFRQKLRRKLRPKQPKTLSLNSPTRSTSIKQNPKSPVMPGSRSALMEQLKMLDTIPDDDEVAKRIQEDPRTDLWH
jgi:hypothetical protein